MISVKDKRFTITIDEKTYKKIEDFRFDNRYGSRNQAVVDIIKAGLKQIENDNNKKDES